ncbi:MAG: DUF2608 domain-containing protein [Gammaproteobacteria bacterium]|nr:DUF2608 domain-containing protein [Gammaproteobacteria bacterium]
MKLLITLIFGIFLTASCFAQSEIITANSFSTVKQLIEQNKHPHHLLLALDDDDTLTMMPCPSPSNCQYLGGPAWYTWQSALSKNNPKRIWKNFPQLLAINNLLFVMSKMTLVDSQIPSALKMANQKGSFTLVASSRGYRMSGATEAQFTHDNILKFIEKGAITTHSDHISFPGIYLPKPWGGKDPLRHIAYIHGVLYLAGQNKGEMLQQFLDKTNQKNNIRSIIFVDDTEQNVVDVANAYKNDPTVNVISIHYTKLKEHKAAFLSGKNAKKLQALSNQRWFAIRDALKKNLPGFDL